MNPSRGHMAAVAKTAFASTPDACPFCGSARTSLQKVDLGSWMAECLDCHATGPVKASAMAAERAWSCRLPYLRPLGQP